MMHQLYYGQKFLPPNYLTRKRCADIRFRTVYSSIQYFSTSFFPNSINDWNNLSSLLANENDYNVFKTNIRSEQEVFSSAI